jgi:hypothetical protein
MVTPLPEDARPDDPRWAVAYLELAHGLVMAGAKAKLIERLTHLRHRQVSELYRALRGIAPPAGPTMPSNPRYFAQRGHDTSDARIIQCAIFLNYYEHMSRITPMPLHRGWLLLAAYNSYLSLTCQPDASAPSKRLDINQAYALLTFSGFLSATAGTALLRRQCPACLIKYPILAKSQGSPQGCPLCAMKANHRRLAAQSRSAAEHRFSGSLQK